MAVIRIVATDMVSQQIHAQALKENRTLSAMGQVLLREALDARRSAAAEQNELLQAGHSTKISQLVSMLKGETGTQ
jgi:hypothetical protein